MSMSIDKPDETEGFNLDDAIRKIPDFPKPGVLFYDITSILANPDAFSYCIDSMLKLYRHEAVDAVAAIESRGFIFAAPFCYKRGIPLLLVRKKGKLPGKTIAQSYDLEYGSAELEMHSDDIKPGAKFLIVDDLIATGGTINATCQMLRACGAVPERVFSVIGLPFLNYRKTVTDLPIDTLIEYFGE
ncbi:MAG: adenine phosphoribosyltransferase [Spirochaetaceae bacterium]|nr:adenine phosphoribosyltransferase [Spirochaetaceae bacterium]